MFVAQVAHGADDNRRPLTGARLEVIDPGTRQHVLNHLLGDQPESVSFQAPLKSMVSSGATLCTDVLQAAINRALTIIIHTRMSLYPLLFFVFQKTAEVGRSIVLVILFEIFGQLGGAGDRII